MHSDEDTIAAIATPIGQAGIGIIRISGPHSYEIAQKIFIPRKKTGSAFQSHRLYLGYLYDPFSNRMIDEVLLSFMKAPHSYTREDVIEVNAHSGYLLLTRVLRIILAQGARLAKPGEFTLRAFLNGRIDLTQAEAVVDLINSKSDRGLYLSSQQTQGLLRREIELLREEVIEVIADIEVAIDFPDEPVDSISYEVAAHRIEEKVVKPIQALIEIHSRKRVWVDGVNTVIVGCVNAGKSSLLNRLLNEQRAIVAPIPGTTRDIVESAVTIEGVPLHLMDTAGFGCMNNEVERIGFHLTEDKLVQADLLLIVIDQSSPLNQHDLDVLARCRGKKALVVLNKTDLKPQLRETEIEERFVGPPIVKISALTGDGLGQLRKAITEYILESDVDMTSSHAIPNLRHRKALEDAVRFFKNAAQNMRDEAPMEIVAVELRSGLDTLGEIIGETVDEEILDSIFSRFCLGK